jgi:hypothetical protein
VGRGVLIQMTLAERWPELRAHAAMEELASVP